MSQNYSEQLRKDNVRDAIYEDLQNNCEVLRTSWSGNAFPANPKVGQPCYRVDEDKLYYWDGYKWSQKGGGGAAKMKVMELPAPGTERHSVKLEGGRCLDKNLMFVFVDKVAQEPSTYDLNSDGTVVNFTPAIPANAALTLRWFSSDVGTTDTSIIATDEEVSAGVAIDKMTERRLPKTAVENLVEDLASKANADLSNLDATGQAKFDAKANTSLSNLDATGQAKFDAKANTSLSNLDATGQAKFDAKADVSVVNGKANTNATNFTANGKQTVVGWVGIDTSSSIARELNKEYTATRNCWIYHDENGNNTSSFYVNGVVVYRTVWHSGVTNAKGSALVFVEKGQKWKAENGVSVKEFGTLGG